MRTTRLAVPFLALQVFIGISVFAQTDYIGTKQNVPGHPRILLLAGEEAAIQKNIKADATWQNMHNTILAESDRLLAEAPIERIQIGRRLLSKSREALRRLFFLSYAYRMTDDQQYLQRGEKEMLAISAFSDWNPSHFLDVAEMTMAVAIGYDWLYNGLSPASRTIIKAAILEKGVNPSLDPKNNGWLRAEHNWNQVCNAGMTYGVLAIYEDEPELAQIIINRAIESIKKPMEEYGPDGAYPEGYSYWGYGTSFNVMFLSAIDKLFKQDFGLSAIPGFLKTAGYFENMTGATGKPFNYSDAGTGSGLEPSMFWFASKLKDASLLWVERSRLLNDDPKTFVRDRLLPGIMLWGSDISINAVTAPASVMWVGGGRTPVALMRGSWTDTSALFVGLKGGSASVNHAHMDIGSFVMEAEGVRWAMDLGMQNYESLESKGMQIFGRSQDAQRWSIFRYNNLAHNTLTVNNRHQLVSGYAPITRSSNDAAFMNAVTDLTEVYKGTLVKAKRGIAIVNKAYVVVRDEVETPDTVTTIRWTLVTPASAVITGKNTVELMKDGKKLLLEVNAPAGIAMKTWSTDPPNSYDAPNPETVMVGFEITLPARSKTAITVSLIPGKALHEPRRQIQMLEQWEHK